MGTNNDPTIAIDMLGGARAPYAPMQAASLIATTTNIRLALLGPLDKLSKRIKDHGLDHAERVTLIDVPTKSTWDFEQEEGHPTLIQEATRHMRDGTVDALVSAGPSGVLVRECGKHLPRIPGIEQLALAAVIPTRERSFSHDRFSLLLDVGATVHCDADALVDFARMGHAYASVVSRVPNPSVGLLNQGASRQRGDDILHAAYATLAADTKLNFIGNIEGHDIPTGLADVIVCEGLLGNVALKLAEGMREVLQNLGSWAFRHSLLWRIGLGLLSGGLRQLKSVTDYEEYGGSPLLGLRHIVINVQHESGPNVLANAIKIAAKSVRDGVVDKISAITTSP